MPNPDKVNQTRDELKSRIGPSGQGSATAEERELAAANQGPAHKGVNRAPKASELSETGTGDQRVWNQWEDETAAKLQADAAAAAAAERGIDTPVAPEAPKDTKK